MTLREKKAIQEFVDARIDAIVNSYTKTNQRCSKLKKRVQMLKQQIFSEFPQKSKGLLYEYESEELYLSILIQEKLYKKGIIDGLKLSHGIQLKNIT